MEAAPEVVRLPHYGGLSRLAAVGISVPLPEDMKQQTLAVAADQNAQYEQYRRPTERDVFLAKMDAIRPFCVGRRNWLFADTVAGAK